MDFDNLGGMDMVEFRNIPGVAVDCAADVEAVPAVTGAVAVEMVEDGLEPRFGCGYAGYNRHDP